VVTRSKCLLVEGSLQNQDNVIHVKATRLTARFAGMLPVFKEEAVRIDCTSVCLERVGATPGAAAESSGL
jgi:hypothetical protein